MRYIPSGGLGTGQGSWCTIRGQFLHADRRIRASDSSKEQAMADVTQSQVEEKLASYVDPYLEKDLVSSKCIKEIGIDGDTASVQVVLGLSRPAGR
jgi:hypothetical protein